MSENKCKRNDCSGKLKRDPRKGECVCMSCYAIHDWDGRLLGKYGRVIKL